MRTSLLRRRESGIHGAGCCHTDVMLVIPDADLWVGRVREFIGDEQHFRFCDAVLHQGAAAGSVLGGHRHVRFGALGGDYRTGDRTPQR